MYTKNDFTILRSIYLKKATTEMISVSIKTIQEDTKLSAVKIRKTLNMFIQDGYVKEGFRKINAKTFYITEKGSNKLIEIMGGNKIC